MKTNAQIKDEPIEIPNYSTKTFNELLHLYDQITKSSKDSDINQEQEPSTCAWCQKLGSKLFTLHTDNGDSKSLCSEVCFNQYRRASFKKNKDSKLSKICPTVKIKSKSTINEIEHSHRRKIFTPYRHSTQTKSKTNGFSRNLSPSSSSSLSLSKRHRSSSSNEKPSSNLPLNLNYSSSFFLPPPPLEINRFQYPFFPPLNPVRQIPLTTTSSENIPSTLISTLTKGLLSNYTCILPTFLPLPIPIPLCFPIHLPCVKCSTDVSNQECQTEISNQRTRRISI